MPREEDFYINHILNITIVDDFLNKREIRAQSPSSYMSKFRKVNPLLNEAMQTHLIMDLNEFGVWENDYDKFFSARANCISQELEKRIIKQENEKELIGKLSFDNEETDNDYDKELY